MAPISVVISLSISSQNIVILQNFYKKIFYIFTGQNLNSFVLPPGGGVKGMVFEKVKLFYENGFVHVFNVLMAADTSDVTQETIEYHHKHKRRAFQMFCHKSSNFYHPED